MPGAARLGLIGVGRWGRNVVRAMPALAGRAVLAGVASRSVETRALLPESCRLFADWRALLAEGGLDGVVIATPPAAHAEMALAAIGHGIAALVEKPLTADPGEAARVAAAAASGAVPVMVDHIHLYNPAFRRLVELLPTLGPLTAIHAVAGNRGPYRADASVLWDWGPHDVAMALRLAGTPDRVALRRLDHAVVDGLAQENLELTLGFPGGLTAVSTFGTLMDKRRQLAVHGAAGVLLYDDLAPARLTRHPPGAPPLPDAAAGEPIACPGAAPLVQVLTEFAAVAAGQAPADDGLALGCQVVTLLAQAERSLAP